MSHTSNIKHNADNGQWRYCQRVFDYFMGVCESALFYILNFWIGREIDPLCCRHSTNFKRLKRCYTKRERSLYLKSGGKRETENLTTIGTVPPRTRLEDGRSIHNVKNEVANLTKPIAVNCPEQPT
eukprot:715649_1